MGRGIVRWLLALGLVAVSAVWALPAGAQDWCGKAATDVEITICATAALGDKDADLNRLFADLRATSSDREGVLTEQRAFLKTRNACGADAPCIANAYDRQIAAFAERLGEGDEADTFAATGEPPLVHLSAVHLEYAQKAAGRADALVVGNFDYRSLPDLATPESDVALVATALRTRGIVSKTLINGSREALLAAIEGFRGAARSDVFVFYYAGHAATIGGHSSVMLPDFDLDRDGRKEAIPISDIVAAISGLGYSKVLVIFDACRNIIDAGPATIQTETIVAEAGTRGPTPLVTRSVELAALQRVEYAISFSAGEGQTALDTVNGSNSPYAEAFAANIREKDTMFDAIVETRRAVRALTDDRQRPTLEMSWDEDFALASSMISAVDYRFWESQPAFIGSDAAGVERDAASFDDSLRLSHRSDGNDGCNTLGPVPNSATFNSSSLDCLTGVYDLSVPQNQMSGTKFTFPTWATYERDGTVGSCETATLSTDIDADGRAETLAFGSNRYGGYVQFDRDRHSAAFYSLLGCNFRDITLYDIDRKGVADLIIAYDCLDQTCLVVLSGEKLVAGIDGDYQMGQPLDDRLASYFAPSEWLGIMGGLAPIALFHDVDLKQWRVWPDSIEYVTYSATWERADTGPNVMPGKSVSLRSDGTIDLRSDGRNYEIASFASGQPLTPKLR